MSPESHPDSAQAYRRILLRAREASARHDRTGARRLAMQAAALDPGQEDAWLLLAALAEPRASLGYLSRALEINPASVRARRGLKWAEDRLRARLSSAAASAGPNADPLRTATSVARRQDGPSRFRPSPRPSGQNWALAIGLAIVLSAAAVSFLGPRVAAHDPLQEKYVFFLPDGSYTKPPLAAFRLPEFPLGTDDYGRDIFSRLLWAVGPSLRIVLLVASLRILLGVAIGLPAGWHERRSGRVLEIFIAAALTVPVIFVALLAIALTGPVLGMWAFVLGLVATGWAEVARLIKEQTRLVRTQPFVEAAHALGASGRQIVVWHIIPQVVPLLWISLAFEISNALMTVAGLGLLGYFINSIWVPLGDWSALRTSGTPELGQMLSTSASEFLTQPYSLLAAGGVIFLIVLGFQLLGEGLRGQMQVAREHRRKGELAQAWGRAGMWLEEHWLGPLSLLRRHGPTLATIGTLAFLVMAGAVYLRNSETVTRIVSAISVPGGHLWGMERHDPQGTSWVPYRGPADPQIAWVFHSSARFSGSPVIAADGTLYVAGEDSQLQAVSPEGKLLWRAALPAPAVGTPAIGASGRIYVVDSQGGLSAYSSSGGRIWTLPDPEGTPALRGPILSSAETIFFPTERDLVAVAADARLIWRRSLPTYSYITPLARLSRDETLLFFEDTVVAAETGVVLLSDTFEAADRYEVGVNDGQSYLTYQAGMRALQPHEEAFVFIERVKVDLRGAGIVNRTLQQAGVTGSGRSWFFYGSIFEHGRVLWFDAQGVWENPVDYPYVRGSLLVGIDEADTLLVCGTIDLGRSLECRANRPGGRAPAWKLGIDAAEQPVGGAIAPGRIYLTTEAGSLYALADPAP